MEGISNSSKKMAFWIFLPSQGVHPHNVHDSDYLFAAQQFLERHLLENNGNVAGQKGKVSKGLDGTTKISCNNAFDIFGKIPELLSTGKTIAMNCLRGWNNLVSVLSFLHYLQLR